jgi:hypothetical protein
MEIALLTAPKAKIEFSGIDINLNPRAILEAAKVENSYLDVSENVAVILPAMPHIPNKEGFGHFMLLPKKGEFCSISMLSPENEILSEMSQLITKWLTNWTENGKQRFVVIAETKPIDAGKKGSIKNHLNLHPHFVQVAGKLPEIKVTGELESKFDEGDENVKHCHDFLRDFAFEYCFLDETLKTGLKFRLKGDNLAGSLYELSTVSIPKRKESVDFDYQSNALLIAIGCDDEGIWIAADFVYTDGCNRSAYYMLGTIFQRTAEVPEKDVRRVQSLNLAEELIKQNCF